MFKPKGVVFLTIIIMLIAFCCSSPESDHQFLTSNLRGVNSSFISSSSSALVVSALSLSHPLQGRQRKSITGVVIETRTNQEKDRSLLFTIPASISGETVDEIRVELSRDAAKQAVGEHLPQGWTCTGIGHYQRSIKGGYRRPMLWNESSGRFVVEAGL